MKSELAEALDTLAALPRRPSADPEGIAEILAKIEPCPRCGAYTCKGCPSPADSPLLREMMAALGATLEWIDAVPSGTPLPTMPGFDRDWVNDLLARYDEGER